MKVVSKEESNEVTKVEVSLAPNSLTWFPVKVR